ncbi:hypothetical protein JJB98_28165 [Bradyrhizobium diazoefficiens]|nr:hypothetical protein [Bradyrhizobium diazoefficiens]QQO23531.1 hypothetical protein JJB98_28165 [Bradyrhizobium diazoefficiens]
MKLPVRRKPYPGPSLARGISLMYRRNKSSGAWVVKASNGYGAYWTKVVGVGDNFDEANGKDVLTFFEAQDAAKKLARGDGTDSNAPLTVDAALTAFEADLKARGASGYNAQWPRVHLTSVLLAKPVALLTSTELQKWRDGFTPQASDVVDFDAMPQVETDSVLRAAGFTVIDRSAETGKGEISVTRF